MKILLVNPPFNYQTPWLQITEPLGLLYLASYIRKYSGHEVSILDCIAGGQIRKLSRNSYYYGMPYSQIIEQIRILKPDVIGLSCMFSRKKDSFMECSGLIHKTFPEIPLVAGGTYPSLFPREVLNSGIFNYCIIGEGEKSFLELIGKIDSHSASFSNIEGLAFRKADGSPCIVNRTHYIENLDEIPFPSRELIDYEKYISRKSILHGLGLRRSASILTSRSCPNRCNFCSMFKIHGPRWRGRSAENVCMEIEELVRKYRIHDLFIMDDNFTFNRERITQICSWLIEKNLNIRWNTPNGISIKTLDKNLLRLMKKSGCKSICIAIESGDEELRNRVIGKRLPDNTIEEITRAASETGIFTTAFYIIGMPGETEEKFQNTLRQIQKLPLNGVAAAFANPLPGTKLYDDCLKNNWTILQSDIPADHENVLYKPYILTPDFTEEALLKREKQFYRTFIRSKFLTILKDTLLFRNGLLYPPFLLRILKDRIFR